MDGSVQAPTLIVGSDLGVEDTQIALSIDAQLVGADSSDVLSIMIVGVPSGASLSAGEDVGDGTWLLTAADLQGLTLTPAPDSGDDITLTVTATATDTSNGATDSTTTALLVPVAAVADAPDLVVTAASGDPGTEIPLNVSAALTDTDGSESLSIRIDGLPPGASINLGFPNEGGSWMIPAEDIPFLNELAITVPDTATEDFNLTFTATSREAENGDATSTVQQLSVSLAGTTPPPTLTVAAAAGQEDAPIDLAITADGADTIMITGVPVGAILSAGENTGDGTWMLTAANLVGLTLIPSNNDSADFTLTVNASSAGGTTTDTIAVAVNAVADAPILTAGAASGDPGASVALQVSAALADTDGSELLSILIQGVPAGASINLGFSNEGGAWMIPAEDIPFLSELAITLPAGITEDFALTLTATSIEGENNDTATTTVSVPVTVILPPPTLSVTAAAGAEDGAISLTIAAQGADSITIVGVPTGASLSAGEDVGEGTWLLSVEDLVGLTLTPPPNSDADITLTVTASNTGGSTVNTLPVTLDAVADQPNLSATGVSGDPGAEIVLPVSASLADTDGSEALSIRIDGVPQGASINLGFPNDGGSWMIPAEDIPFLNELAITLPGDITENFSLTVTAISTEGDNGDSASASVSLPVTINALPPTLTVAAATGPEDTAISLTITADGAESIMIVGVPSGASLSAGEDVGEGSWLLSPADLVGLTLTPAENSDADLTLTVTATSPGGSTVDTLPVTVDAVADAPNLNAGAAVGGEDTAIAIPISASLVDTDGSESLSITIVGVPSGATLSAGEDVGEGTWLLSAADLAGLTVTPPPNSDADFTLTITATADEGANGSSASTTTQTQVTVNAAADAPQLVVGAATGAEDSAIDLAISAALTDTDGSETLSVVIDGVPAGAALSSGTLNADGTWTVDPGDLAGLTLTPPADSAADFSLTVTAVSTEDDNGSTASTVSQLPVTVTAVADDPVLSAEPAEGDANSAIALPITAALGDTDGSEELTVTIVGVPSGASLSAGEDVGEGTWLLSASDLDGLTVTPAPDSDADFILTITATSTEAENGDSASTTVQMPVTVNEVPDLPTLVVGPATGNEDTSIALSIGADGADFVTISGVPSGASLSAGDDTGNGTWVVNAADLNGLTVTPPADSDVDFSLSVTATSAGGTTDPAALPVVVDAVADTPDLSFGTGPAFAAASLAAAPADADSRPGTAPININASLNDTDGSEVLTITIDGVPDGARLSAGTVGDDGTWALGVEDLAGLQLIVPGGTGGDFALTVTATSTELANGQSSSVSGTVKLHIDPSDTGKIVVDYGNHSDCVVLDGRDPNHPGFDVDMGGGNDRVTILGDGDNIIDGGSGNDRIRVDDGNNVIDGGSGNDNIRADDGNNVIDGGTGNDRIRVDDGNNVIDGGSGNDYIRADDGDNVIDGGTGNDRIYVDDGDNQIDGGTGNDYIRADDGDNVIDGGTGNDRIIADDGDNVIDGGTGNDTIKVDDGDNVIDGGTGNDYIRADDGDNTIDGGAGNDTIKVDDGDNVIDGGTGNDYIRADDGDNTIDGGAGNDTIKVDDGDNVIDGGTGNDYIRADDGDNTIDGGTGNDFIRVDDGDNTIDGGSGNDIIFADDGDNVINGGTGNDYIRVDDGDNVIDGGTGNDYIRAGDGDDLLFGNAGNDFIKAGRGDDIMIGGEGQDWAYGQSGNDLYVFGPGSGDDYFNGGRGGWVDAVELQGVEGDFDSGEWSLELTRGQVIGVTDDTIILSKDAAGTITIANDGSELTFEGVEQINW